MTSASNGTDGGDQTVAGASSESETWVRQRIFFAVSSYSTRVPLETGTAQITHVPGKRTVSSRSTGSTFTNRTKRQQGGL